MKKNVLPDYPTDDVPSGFYFQMKNRLSHIVDRIPSGLSTISRAEMEASVSSPDSGTNLPKLHDAIKTGVCHPHLLLLQTVGTPSLSPRKLLLVWVSARANKCLGKANFCGHQHQNRRLRVPFRELSLFVLSGRNFPPRIPSLPSLGFIALL